jgi:hypothetical protein
MIELLEERNQTGEYWYRYRVTVDGSWDWVNGFEISCYTGSKGNILLDMPHVESAY